VKKVVLVALVLVVCGVLYDSVLAQEKPRYLVTYVRSLALQNPLIQRSATVVTVVNQSSLSCDVQVEWFAGNATSPLCTVITNGVAPGAPLNFCTRPLPGSVTTCSDACDPPILGNFQGKAIVSSSEGLSQGFDECSLIAVDARVYYMALGSDAAVSAISNSKVVFFGEGNLGD
jgi:hypothetical protein